MGNSYRIITDGAGQELVAQLDALLGMITNGTTTTVAAYTSKAPLTEETGRNIAAKTASLYTAFKTYIAPSAKKLNHTITIGTTTFDGSANKTVAAATQSAAGLLSAADKTKLDGIETGATKIRVKGNAESSYRKGDVNITPANIGLGNVDNVKQYSASNPPPYPVSKVQNKTGAVTLTVADILGSTPIGDDFTGIYYNGNRFVTQNPSLAGSSWAKIAELSAAGKAKKAFSIGDEKTVTLTTGETITLVILGFYHDEKTAGGKAGITFGMKDLLNTSYPMNATNVNAGGWDQSKMRTETMATLLSQLPSDLASVIKPVNKKATAGSQSGTITTSSDKLWLLSAAELWSKTAIENSTNPDIKGNAVAYKGEGEQYEYYKNTVEDAEPNNSCPALVKRKNGSAYYWWLRSPYIGYAYYFRGVNSTGSVNYTTASSAWGVCFGFCV